MATTQKKMKKLMTIFGAFLLASFVLTSCGTKDPEKNGEKAGKILCELEELKEEVDDLEDDIDDLEWDDDDERKEIADLEEQKFKLELKGYELRKNIAELENNKWSAIEDEDDKDDWMEDYREAKADYIEDNCESRDSKRDRRDRDR